MKLKLSLLTLFMAFVVQFSFAQEKTITGTISDETGMPLPGVNVVIKGTTSGTQTDFDGNYSISAQVGNVLVFSYVGYQTQERTVGSANTMSFKMVSGEQLEEVVIVAYGTQTKESVVSSVSTVTSEKIENVPIASFDQILKGQSPGLHVISGSGQPGSAAKVRIRGTHSINGSSTPLYVLDGTPITAADFATLNPNDFESVSVLKDASAAALYGSRGGSGVIVITTKRGKEGRANIRYTSQYGISEIGQLRFEMMNSREKMTFENWQSPGKWSDEDIANAPNTDWSDYFFRQGTTLTHDFSVSGGSEKAQYFTSLSYYDQEGIGIRSDLKRFGYRLNLDYQATDKFKIGAKSYIGYSKSNFISSEAGVNLNNPFAAVYLANPYHLPYNEDGSYNTGGGLVGGNSLQNLNENTSKQNDLKINASVYGELELMKNVTARVNMGLDYINRLAEQGIGPDTFLGQNGGLTGNAGVYRFNNNYEANINILSSLNYSNTFNDVHNVDFTVFMEYYKYHAQGGNYSGFGINPKLVGYASGVTAGTPTNGFIPTVGGFVARRGLLGYFASGKYDYDNKYFFEGNIRRDASSRFSDANKWGTFYSVALGWALHKESFMENVDWINNLKLRASYGTVGNQFGIGDFQDEGLYGQTTYNGIAGIVATSIGNNQLKWEESARLNIGLDFGLFNNRISGGVDYYVEKISDLFIDQQLSLSSGFGSIDANAGKMENRGVDAFIDIALIRGEEFTWNINANFNYNKNEITDLGQEEEYELGTSIIREGLPFGSHYVVGWAGVNPANGAPLYLDADQNVTDLFSQDNSLAIWGSSEPIWTGGFGTNLSYKGFNLSSAFTFAGDYYRFNNQTFFQENPNFSQYNLSTAMLSIWRNPGDVTDIQGFGYNREFTSKDIENASYLRITNVTLSYTLPRKFIDDIELLQGLKFFVQGTNLYTWTNFSGFDPEDANNIAQYEYPTPRTITFGVDVNF